MVTPTRPASNRRPGCLTRQLSQVVEDEIATLTKIYDDLVANGATEQELGEAKQRCVLLDVDPGVS